MSNITASLGISQIKKLEKITEMRRGNASYLNKKLDNIIGINISFFPNV